MTGMPSPSPSAASLFFEFPGFPRKSGWRAGFTTLGCNGSLDPILPPLGWTGLPIHHLTQRHGNRVLVAGPEQRGKENLGEGDGLVTALRGTILTVATADCVPIVIFDPERGAGGVLHAGWRGTRARIARAGVDTLNLEFGCRREEILAFIGPSIGHCCYQVNRDVLEAFQESGFPLAGLVREDADATFLNLGEANLRDLVAAGVRSERIHAAGGCTRCHPALFPSYRREGAGTGRILTFLGSARES